MTDERDPVVDEIVSELVASAPVAPPFPDALAMSSPSRRPRRGVRAAIAVVAAALVVVAVVLIVVLATDTVGHTPVDPRPTPPVDGPLTGKDVPTTGFAILTDQKGGGLQNLPSTYLVTLVDDAGTEIASLGRQVVSNDAFNNPPTKLVRMNGSAKLEHQPLAAAGVGAPADCTVTGSSVTTRGSESTLAAVCGTRNGDQLIGDRIVTYPGTIGKAALFTVLIEDPPRPAGMPGGGHWTNAEASPDGRWVLAQWSGECEAQNAFLLPASGGAVYAATGEAGTAWTDAPSSSALGWTADGKAIIQLGPAACGTSSSDPAGIYVVSPDDRTRTLRYALPAGEPRVLRWTSVDDRG